MGLPDSNELRRRRLEAQTAASERSRIAGEQSALTARRIEHARKQSALLLAEFAAKARELDIRPRKIEAHLSAWGPGTVTWVIGYDLVSAGFIVTCPPMEYCVKQLRQSLFRRTLRDQIRAVTEPSTFRRQQASDHAPQFWNLMGPLVPSTDPRFEWTPPDVYLSELEGSLTEFLVTAS